MTILNDRVKKIGKVNSEIAEWFLVIPLRLLRLLTMALTRLQERRKVEEAYVQGLKKLANKQVPGPQSELGYDTAPTVNSIFIFVANMVAAYS